MGRLRGGSLPPAAARAAEAARCALARKQAAAATERTPVVPINDEEHTRIGELIAANTWPQGWDGTEITGDVLLPQVMKEGVTEALLMNVEEEAA